MGTGAAVTFTHSECGGDLPRLVGFLAHVLLPKLTRKPHTLSQNIRSPMISRSCPISELSEGAFKSNDLAQPDSLRIAVQQSLTQDGSEPQATHMLRGPEADPHAWPGDEHAVLSRVINIPNHNLYQRPWFKTIYT